jgi:hypothetical protein
MVVKISNFPSVYLPSSNNKKSTLKENFDQEDRMILLSQVRWIRNDFAWLDPDPGVHK